MNRQDVIDFFDRLAPTWDAEQADRGQIVERILDNAGVGAGHRVLDVACGTGVLFEHYLRRGVRCVTAVDISPVMCGLAREKAAGNPRIRVVCGDVEELCFDTPFDRIVVYNAFPHFPDGGRLASRLAGWLAPAGRLTIAHGFSRETINAHHSGAARHVSNGLMPAGELKALLEPWLDVDIAISDDEMYQVVGTRR